ncbi:hypothetical protein ACE1B6_17675 [Aerosakkonemataceae cyanobacterium BLCC-F154]|uniref:Uncharacterized protein n=1 Tax=Floridaenema fluviatile BLCC-F154 TaxID=3153640 RepID=A0ABV4YE23_9CYAN
MDQGIAALLGVIIGSILTSLSSIFRSRMIGSRFLAALEVEIQEAKDSIHQKMRWVSRDASCMKGQIDARLLVEYNGKVLLLGEEEDFVISLPFWDANIREIVEIIPTKQFKRICNEVILIRKFALKFRDIKMAFKIVMGDPAWMARECYIDLLNIHNQLIPNQSL